MLTTPLADCLALARLRLSVTILTPFGLLTGAGMAANITWNVPGPAPWTTGSNWDSGSPPAAADSVYFKNGGTATLTGMNNITIARLLPSHGKLTMSGGELKMTSSSYFGYGREDVSGTFLLEMSGNARIDANSLMFADVDNHVGIDSQANITLNDSASITIRNGWTVIGRYGGSAEVHLYGKSKIDHIRGKGTDIQFIVGDGSGSGRPIFYNHGRLTMHDQSRLNTNIPLYIGAAGAEGTLTLLDESTVAINNFISVARDGGKATLNLHGGTLIGDYMERDPKLSSVIDIKGGTIRTNGNQDHLFRFTKDSKGANFATIQTEGLALDTAGFDVEIQVPLGGLGGLSKTGAGTLRISSPQNYKGGTTVAQGTLNLVPGVNLNSAVTVFSEASVRIGGDQGQTARVPSLTLQNHSTLSFRNLGPATGAPRLEVTGTFSTSGTIPVEVLGYLVPGEYPLIAHNGPVAGAGMAAFDLQKGDLEATLQDKNGIVTLVVTGGTIPSGYTVEWGAASGSATVGDNWIGGLAPGPTGTAIIQNGGEMIIADMDDIIYNNARLIKGSVNMTGGSLYFTEGATFIADANHGQNSNFLLTMSGNSVVSGVGLHIGNANLNAEGLEAVGTVVMNDNAAYINRSSWMIIGRWRGAANVTLNGNSRIESLETNPAKFLGIGEVGQAPSSPTRNYGHVTLNDHAQLKTHSSLIIGQALADGTLIANDQSEVYSASYVELARTTAGNGTLLLNGGTLTTGAIRRASSVARVTLGANGGTIRALTNQPDFFQYSDNEARGSFLTIQQGGLTFDTNGFNVGLKAEMAGTGDFIKQGMGTLAFKVSQDHTGMNYVDGGTLELATGTELRGNIQVSPGATLAIAGDDFDFASVESITMDDGATLDFKAIDRDGIGAVLEIGDTLALFGQVSVRVPAGLPVGSYPLLSHFSQDLDGDGVSALKLVTPGMVGHFEDENSSMVILHITEVAETGYAAWAAEMGLDATNHAASDDPDSDGVPNALEYYLGGNPLETNASILPKMGLGPNGPVYRFTRREGVAGELALQNVEISDDLQDWSMAAPVPATSVDLGDVRILVHSNGDGTETVQISQVPGSGKAPRIFLRLRIELKP